MSAMLTVYHYTNKEGRDAIKKSGKILQSGDLEKDAILGKGVYLTTLSPEDGKKKVGKNNWEGVYKQALADGKLNYAIRIDIPEKQLRKGDGTSRIIYVYNGDLVLKTYRHEFIECRWEEAAAAAAAVAFIKEAVPSLALPQFIATLMVFARLQAAGYQPST